MLNPKEIKEYIAAMAFLPQTFDEVLRQEGDHLIERMSNGNIILHRRDNAYRWSSVGDIHKEWPSGQYVTLINKPYDLGEDSDCALMYQGDSQEMAIEILWQHRYEATA